MCSNKQESAEIKDNWSKDIQVIGLRWSEMQKLYWKNKKH